VSAKPSNLVSVIPALAAAAHTVKRKYRNGIFGVVTLALLDSLLSKKR
jgi:hypothetical protein